MFEPAAVVIVLGASFVGRLVGGRGRHRRAGASGSGAAPAAHGARAGRRRPARGARVRRARRLDRAGPCRRSSTPAAARRAICAPSTRGPPSSTHSSRTIDRLGGPERLRRCGEVISAGPGPGTVRAPQRRPRRPDPARLRRGRERQPGRLHLPPARPPAEPDRRLSPARRTTTAGRCARCARPRRVPSGRRRRAAGTRPRSSDNCPRQFGSAASEAPTVGRARPEPVLEEPARARTPGRGSGRSRRQARWITSGGGATDRPQSTPWRTDRNRRRSPGRARGAGWAGCARGSARRAASRRRGCGSRSSRSRWCGGLGAILYLAAWLILPEPLAGGGRAAARAGSWCSSRRSRGSSAWSLLGAAGAAATVFGFGWIVFGVAAAAFIGALSVRRLGLGWALLPVAALTVPGGGARGRAACSSRRPTARRCSAFPRARSPRAAARRTAPGWGRCCSTCATPRCRATAGSCCASTPGSGARSSRCPATSA